MIRTVLETARMLEQGMELLRSRDDSVWMHRMRASAGNQNKRLTVR